MFINSFDNGRGLMRAGIGWLSYTLMLVALALRLSSDASANFSYLVLAALALGGRAQAIYALTISWLFSMLNPGFAPEANSAGVGRYLVIASVAISVGWRSMRERAPVRGLSLGTVLLGVLLLVHSLIFSVVVDVSVLKVASWVVVVLSLLSAWSGMPFDQREDVLRRLLRGLILLIFVSLPLLAVPSIGFLRNGTGFQGVLGHPQAFGPMVALVGALVGGRILGEPQPAWSDIVILAVCSFLVVMSEARTAGLAMVLGLIGAAIFSPIFAGVSRRKMLPGLRSRRFQVLALLALIGLFLAGPVLVGPLTSYLLKRGDVTNFLDAADASRGPLVDAMLDNIRQAPFTGIGFGIASEPDLMVIERDETLDLPISAQIEKGVMPIAVVEELGLLVSVPVFAWFAVVLRKGARAGTPQFAVLITLLLVNLGESVFFSVGGMGMLLLILLAASVSREEAR